MAKDATEENKDLEERFSRSFAYSPIHTTNGVDVFFDPTPCDSAIMFGNEVRHPINHLGLVLDLNFFND